MDNKSQIYTESDLLNPAEAAKFLRVSRATIYNLVNQNQIPHRKVGNQPRFPFWLLKEWVEGKEVS